MKCVVCTLFEHHYHWGVAVLVNSLCQAGFQGTIYAGFRGPLPPWAEHQVRLLEPNQWEMQVSPDVRIHFLRLETSAHFTNFKPDFLLQIEPMASKESDAVIYCDPDIVINTNWRFVDDWLSCGVALCEDVNSPIGENHPKRIGWRRFFKPLGHELEFHCPEYANGGWIGLRWEYRKFLLVWQELMTQMAIALGGSDIVGIEGGRTLQTSYGFANCFDKTDQDALNATIEACPDLPVSFLKGDAMGFLDGQALLPHALGPSKPWRRRYLLEALVGCPPNMVDRIFWNKADSPIHPFSPAFVRAKRLELMVGAALGRLIRRA